MTINILSIKTNDPMTNDTMIKKYILKPGKHQFAPGSAAVHSNDNINDEEAKWYIEKYPHIAGLFTQVPKGPKLVPLSPKKNKVQEVKSSENAIGSDHTGPYLIKIQ
jgi:hypothetical protein